MIAKELFKSLLFGWKFANNGRYGAVLRDPEGKPYERIQARTFDNLKFYYLRKEKNGLFVVDLRKVRALHGNHIFKKLYREKNAKAKLSAKK